MGIRRAIYAGTVILLAVLAAAGTRQVLGRGAPRQTTVYAAAADIPASTVITPGQVRREVIDVPAYPGAAADPAGKIAAVPMVPGQVILNDMLTSPGEAGLAYRVPRGMYAMAVPTNKVTSVAGAIRPGDLIDVIGAGPDGQRQDLLAAVPVLATSNDTITLEVSQDGALTLDAAELRGSLDIILRGER